MENHVLFAFLIISFAVIGSAFASCGCDEPLWVNSVGVDAPGVRSKALHTMKNVYRDAADLFRRINMPLIGFDVQSYEVDEADGAACFMAEIVGGEYFIRDSLRSASVVFVGEATEGSLANMACSCEPNPADGAFDEEVCDLLRIKAGNMIEGIKKKLEGEGTKGS